VGPLGLSPKKIGDDIAKATGDWKGLKVTVQLKIQNRQAEVSIFAYGVYSFRTYCTGMQYFKGTVYSSWSSNFSEVLVILSEFRIRPNPKWFVFKDPHPNLLISDPPSEKTFINFKKLQIRENFKIGANKIITLVYRYGTCKNSMKKVKTIHRYRYSLGCTHITWKS